MQTPLETGIWAQPTAADEATFLNRVRKLGEQHRHDYIAEAKVLGFDDETTPRPSNPNHADDAKAAEAIARITDAPVNVVIAGEPYATRSPRLGTLRALLTPIAAVLRANPQILRRFFSLSSLPSEDAQLAGASALFDLLHAVAETGEDGRAAAGALVADVFQRADAFPVPRSQALEAWTWVDGLRADAGLAVLEVAVSAIPFDGCSAVLGKLFPSVQAIAAATK